MAKKPKRRHPQPPPGPRGPGLEEILSRVQALQEEKKYKEALQVLDEAPPHLQRRPELLMVRGVLQASLGNLQEAMLTLEEAQRRDPDNLLTYYLLGLMYDEMDLTAHARRALREFVEYRDILPGKLVKEAQEFLDELEDLLTHFAKAMGLPLDRAEEAVYELELGKRATETGDVSSALRHFRRASSLAPRWIAPRGLEGEVLLMDGQPRKAIEVAEQLLKDSPGLQPAIIILVRAHLMLGNREAAEAAARSLRGLSVDSPASLESVVLTLGYLNDDAEIYRLYRQHRHLIKEIEDAPSLIVIGSAAANLGHFRTARRLWEQAMSYPGGLAEALSALMAAAIRKAPGPGIADRYPTFQFVQLMPNRVAREMNELLELWETGEIDRKPFQKRLRGLVARYPIVFSQLVQMFRESASRFLWIDILALLGTPEAVEELRRFAFSQKGKLAERMVALQSLDEEGLMDVSQPVELWDEFRQEWRRLRIPRWRVLENDPDRYPRQAIEMTEEVLRALEEDRLQDAQALTEKALSFVNEPDPCVFLGLAWGNDPPRAEACFRKAVELDPKSAGGWSGLALLALNRGDLPAARQCLEVLADRKEFTLWEFLVYLRALTAISVSEEDLALARFYVTTALSWHPDDEHFQQLDLVLALQEPDSGLNVLLQQSRQYRERRRSRPIPPDASLRQCLERITRESLVATAKTYSVPYVALRKEDLIQNLVEAITDPERLREALTELDAEERQALRDVLDAGGILPWDEFTARYGDDLEDSLEWSFFLPETLMGRLRLYGLLSDGTVEGQRVVLIPRELRELLPSALAAVEETSDRQDDAV